MTATCSTCRFWAAMGRPDDDGTPFILGQCRRRAPRGGEPLWPETRRDAWCGEHEPREPVSGAAKAFAAHRVEAAAQERARIVALIRARADACRMSSPFGQNCVTVEGSALFEMADAIERGEHVKEG